MLLQTNTTHNTVVITASVENPVILASPRASSELVSVGVLLSSNLVIGRSARVGNASRDVLIQQIPATNIGRTSSFVIGLRNSNTSSALTIRSVQFSRNDMRLAATVALPRTINAGLIDTVSAVFAPTQTGDIPVQVIITYTIGASATVLADTAIIAALGIPANQVVYSGIGRSGFVQFGTARVGGQVPAQQAPFVENIGVNAAVMAVSLSGTSAREFVVGRPFPTMTVQAETDDSLQVVFRPTSPGFKQAQMTLTPQSGTPIVYTLSGRAVPALSTEITPRPTATQTASAGEFNVGRVEIGTSSIATLGLRVENILAPVTVSVQGRSEFLVRVGNAVGTSVTIAPDDLNSIIDSIQVIATPINIDTVSAILTVRAENTTRSINVRMEGIASTRPGFLFNGVSGISFDTNQVIGINDSKSLRIIGQNIRGRVSITLPNNIGVQTSSGAQFGTVPLLTVPSGVTRLAWDTTLVLLHVPTIPTRMVDSLVLTMQEGTTQIAQASLFLTARARYADGITQIGTGVFAPIMVNSVASQTVNLIINTVRGSSATITIARRSTEATFQLVERGVLRDSIVLRVRQTTASNAMLISTSITVRFSPTQEGTFTDILNVSAVSDSVQYASEIALFGGARPLIQFDTPTTGVEFGTVPAGAIRARQVPIQIANMTDTVFVVRSKESSAFSLSVGEAHRVSQFFIPADANQTADTLCAVLFEPDDTQRYQDTLNFFQRGERVFMIVLGGNGTTSNVVSVQMSSHDATLKITPSIVESGSATAEFSASNTQPIALTILSVEGRTMYREDIQTMRSGRLMIPIATHNLPTGMYFVVIDQAGKRYGAKMIIRR